MLILDGDSHINGDGEIVSGAPKAVSVHEFFKHRGIQHLIYTSYSNDIGLPKYRVIIPCEYSPEQLSILLDYLFKLLLEAGVMLAPVPENRTWSQPWYFPRVPDEQRKALFEFFQFSKGENLNADAITAVWLKEHPPTPTIVLEIAQMVRNKRAILQHGLLRDALAKYQIMLDNELYKAIKALRETQTWRLESLVWLCFGKSKIFCSLFCYVHY